MKLEINHKKKTWRKYEHMEMKKHTTKNKWINDEIKEEIGKYLETNDNENTTLQIYAIQF